jgi:hypothetical protein
VDSNVRLLLAAANDDEFTGWAAPAPRRPFGVEIGCRGLFLQLWRFDAYLCTEPEGAWSFIREPGGFDLQVWRLHLLVGRVPG